jgi:rubredoxin/flavin reductase (DIM6/NTAB) family NADH-FMN oxidoreductase RutF
MNGFIGNAVMQLTSDPIQIAVCTSKNNFTTELIRKSKKVAISALDINTPKEIIGTFGYKSGKVVDKFAGTKFFVEDDIPIFTQNTLAYYYGDVVSEQDLGSHFLFVININRSEILDYDTPPITYQYYRDVYKGHSPKNAPTYVDTSMIKIQAQRNDVWICDLCKYEYNPEVGDPDAGIAPGTKFEDLPDKWVCPVCARTKEEFSKKNNNNLISKKMDTTKQDIWICEICSYEYDPVIGDTDSGIAPGTAFEDIPDNWACPICGVGKIDFKKK